MTERSPFTESSSRPSSKGEATLFVGKVLENAGIDYDLQYLPWRRAYRYTQERPNVLIYPLARSPERESRFHWIGQLIPVGYYLFKLRSRDDIEIEVLEDARKYRIGVVNFHVHHQFLKSEGFDNLQPVNSTLQNFNKALLGRIDLFPVSDGGLIPFCHQEQIDCSLFEPVFKLKEISGSLYLAFSKPTNPEIVDAARKAYESLVRSGTHQQIFHERFMEIEKFNNRWPTIAAQ